MEPKIVQVVNPVNLTFQASWQGAWNSSSAYTLGQAVSYNGSSYVAVQNTIPANTLPDSNPGSWTLIAKAGTQSGTTTITISGTTFPVIKSTANRPNTSATVTTVSSTIVPANITTSGYTGRSQVWIYNLSSTETVYLSLGSIASIGSGIRLNPNGGYYTSTTYQGAINAICTNFSGGTASVSISEV